MSRVLACVIVLVLFAFPARATVEDGSYWSFPDGTVAAASVGSDGTGNTLTVIDESGFSNSNAAWGTPAIQSSGIVTTPNGSQYQASTVGSTTGKLKKKINGKWVKGREIRAGSTSGKRGRSRGMGTHDKWGWEDPSSLAPVDVVVPSIVPFGPGDETTSLPFPGVSAPVEGRR